MTTTPVVVTAGAVVAVAMFTAGARRPATILLALMVLLPLTQAVLKDLVDRPRPSPGLVEVRGSATSESFPSGHVMSPMTLYGFLLLLMLGDRLPGLPRSLLMFMSASAVALLALSGIVNVHLGVHWPSDVLGGYLWGSALAATAALVLAAWQRRA